MDIKHFLPEFTYPFITIIENALIAIIILIVGWLVSKLLARVVLGALTRKNIDVAMSRFLSHIVRYLILAASVIASLGTVGVQTTSLVAILGSAALAIGLALQGSLSHFASGVLILFFRPFSIDDWVTIAGTTGKVVDIGIFATTLITGDNKRVTIPNGKVIGDTITNITIMGTRRAEISVGVAYGTDTTQAKTAMLTAVQKVEGVLEDPAPDARFSGFGASSLDFTVWAWCNAGDFGKVMHNAHVEIYNELNAQNIDIPFDQIVVHKAE